MAISLNSRQIVPFEELLMAQVVHQGALTRLLMGRTPILSLKKWLRCS